MIRDIVTEIRNAPEKLVQRGTEARKWLKQRAFEAREQGENGLWNLQLSAFETVEDLLEKAATVPVLERVSPSAREWLDGLEEAATAPPMDDYDELNVRKIMGQLHALDRFGLLKIERYETAHKNRKTVLDAVQREMEKRARLAAA